MCFTAHRQCPINCAEKDRARKKFFKDLYHFPNLFSLSAWFHDTDRVHALLRRTEEELQDGRLQHPLEEVRSHNLIVFLQYRLGCKQKALEYCRGLQEDTSMNKSIIFLTLLAMLQYELKPPRVHKKTLATLQDLCHASDFEYLQAVAESEKGNALISIGPMGFVNAMDCFQRAIDTCPDILLWKYDLALAIRRHFNPYAFSKHPKHPAPVLAQKAVELLRNTAAECTDSFYEVRSIVELARLVSHLQLFCTVCSEDEKVTISKLIEEYDEQHLYEEAFKKDCSKDDFYTIRECGRHFLSVKSFDKAVQCFQASYSKRKTSMVCQLFGKAYLNMYKSSCNPPALPSPADFEERSESRCRATLPSTSPEPTAELLQDLKTSMVRLKLVAFWSIKIIYGSRCNLLWLFGCLDVHLALLKLKHWKTMMLNAPILKVKKEPWMVLCYWLIKHISLISSCDSYISDLWSFHLDKKLCHVH